MARLPEYITTTYPRIHDQLPYGVAEVTIHVDYGHPGFWRWVWNEFKKANRDKSSVQLMQAARCLIKEKQQHGCIGGVYRDG